MTAAADAVRALAVEPYVRLTTFRRSGEPVHTAVWIVADGDRLLVTTGAVSGKVKRIGHTSRVELVPSDVRGAVAGGAVPVVAQARADDDPELRDVLDRALLAKYGDRYATIKAARATPSASTALVITAPTARAS